MRLESTQKRYHAFWDSMIQVPTDASLWREVEILLSRLDRSGRIIPLPDAVIACCALRIQATVLTWDEHFREIPGLSTLYPSELI